MGKTNQVSEQLPVKQDFEKLEKIKLIAYRLWLARRDNNIPGDAVGDYYYAERILESHRSRKLLLLSSFALSAVAFVLGRCAEEHHANATNAVIRLNEPGDEYEHLERW